MRHASTIFVCAAVLVGCHSTPTKQPNVSCEPFAQPRPPLPDADPTRRRLMSIQVPTGVQIVQRRGRSRLVFTGFQAAQITVGHKMLAGVTEELEVANGETTIIGTHGGLLPSRIPGFHQSFSTNEVFTELRLTVFETDQPPGYHVDPSDSRFYRVLWTRTFHAPFEGINASKSDTWNVCRHVTVLRKTRSY